MSDEEVKYTVTAEGHISELSKTVIGGIGEAVGINYISSGDKKAFIRQLSRVDDQDYFERGLELAIAEDGVRLAAARHLGPLRRRGRLRRRPRAGEPLRLTLRSRDAGVCQAQRLPSAHA